MKKIFTLVFSLGLLTAAFAQGGHDSRNYNSTNGSGNQSWRQGDQQGYKNGQAYQAAPYSKSDNWNDQSNDQRNEHRYDNDINHRDNFWNKDERRGSLGSRFNDSRFYKGMNYRHSEAHKRKPGLQISLSFGSDHK